MNSKQSYPFHLPSVEDLSNSKYSTPESSNLQSIDKISESMRPPIIPGSSLSSDKSSSSSANTINTIPNSATSISLSTSATSSNSNNTLLPDGNLVKLARRRANRSAKEKNGHKRVVNLSRPQGRPLSKETRVRLTLVPTLGILYSILVSDTMRKSLKVVKYGDDEKDSVVKTNEELSTRNIISGFSSLLNVQTVRFLDDPSSSPNKHSNIPEFTNIDDAVYNLFGLTDYSLIRVTRAAATEIGGSVLLKIETAMPGHLYLNDDEDEDFQTVELNKDYYQESIGSIGDRPSTTFLKKRVARPRYKSDMRIYLIPKSVSCAIYCESRMFKRDLLRGFLNMEKLDRSVIVAFDYDDLLKELKSEGHSDLINKNLMPTVDQVRDIEESVQQMLTQTNAAFQNEAVYPKPPVLQQHYTPSQVFPRSSYEAQIQPPAPVNYQNYSQYQPAGQYVQPPPQQQLSINQQSQMNQSQTPQSGLGYPTYNQYNGGYSSAPAPSGSTQLAYSTPNQPQQQQQQQPQSAPQQQINQNHVPQQQTPLQQQNGSILGYSTLEAQYLAQPAGLMSQQVTTLAPGSYITTAPLNDPNRRFIDPYSNGQFYYQPPNSQMSSISNPGSGYQTNGGQQFAAIYAPHRPDDAQVGYTGFP